MTHVQIANIRNPNTHTATWHIGRRERELKVKGGQHKLKRETELRKNSYQPRDVSELSPNSFHETTEGGILFSGLRAASAPVIPRCVRRKWSQSRGAYDNVEGTRQASGVAAAVGV